MIVNLLVLCKGIFRLVSMLINCLLLSKLLCLPLTHRFLLKEVGLAVNTYLPITPTQFTNGAIPTVCVVTIPATLPINNNAALDSWTDKPQNQVLEICITLCKFKL